MGTFRLHSASLLPGPSASALAEAYRELWAWASPAPVAGVRGEAAASQWYLDSQVPLWTRHSEDPAAKGGCLGLVVCAGWPLNTTSYTTPGTTLCFRGAVAALPANVAAALGGGGADETAGVSMLWLTRDVPAGAEVTRDHLPGKRSLQRAAALLALLGRPPRCSPDSALYALPFPPCAILCYLHARYL